MSKRTKESKRSRAGAGAVSRRSALSGLGALGAGAALSAAVSGCKKGWRPPEEDPTGLSRHKPYVPGAEEFATFEERWLNTSCGQCPAGCGIRVRVVEGRAVRIEGNPANPLNRGGVGPRGLSGLQALYDNDRIRTPLVRDNGLLVPTSWEQGMALAADRLRGLRAAGKPDKLLVLSGRERGFMHELFERFCLAFGTPQYVDGRPGHSAALAQAMDACLGSFEVPAFAWPRVGYVLGVEDGLLEDSCQSVYLARVSAELRRGPGGRRAKLVHAGPVFDLSAYNADDWLRTTPGTGGALTLALCHVLLRDHPGELATLRDQSDGFDEFREFVAGFAPDKVCDLTGVPGKLVERTAAELWDSRPSMAVVDERSLAFSNGLETATAVLALNALLAAGEGATTALGVAPVPPFAAWPEPDLDAVARTGLARPRLDGAGSAAFPRARSVHETLPEAILGDASNRPEVALLYYTNPVYARQQPTRWREALDAIPFVVSFSPFRDETVEAVADLVLPDHSYLERWEDAAPAPGVMHTVAGVRRPVIEPLHDTRATGDVVIALARAIGGNVAGAFPWAEAREPFRAAIEGRYAGLRRAGRGTIRIADERDFLARLYEEGFWAEDAGVEPEPRRFRFQTGWEAPRWAGDAGKFPLRLLAYRPLGYAEGSGANQPWLRTLRSRPGLSAWSLPASMHPDTPGFSIGDGEPVTVTSPWGEISLPARLDERMQPGYVAIPMGGGHTAFGRWAAGFGVNVMTLLAPGPAPVSGANLLCGTRVRVSKGAPG